MSCYEWQRSIKEQINSLISSLRNNRDSNKFTPVVNANLILGKFGKIIISYTKSYQTMHIKGTFNLYYSKEQRHRVFGFNEFKYYETNK